MSNFSKNIIPSFFRQTRSHIKSTILVSGVSTNFHTFNEVSIDPGMEPIPRVQAFKSIPNKRIFFHSFFYFLV